MDYKVIKIVEPGNLQICSEELPEYLSEDDVLIKVKAAGVCGSDIAIYKGTSPVATYPRVIGHEIAGEIAKIGSNVKDLKIGDHVVIDPVISCGHCYPCSKGKGNVCVDLKVRGVHIDGGYGEYTIAPQKNVYKISNKISFEEAALVEPFTIAAQVLSIGQITANDFVLINGSGAIGLIILQAVKLIGAKCIVSDLLDSRLEKAKYFGADITVNPKKQDIFDVVKKETNGLGMNVIIDAVGIPQILEQAIKLASSAGTIVTLGFNSKGASISELDITQKELEIKGSRLNSKKFPQVIEWFEKGLIHPKEMISQEFYFEDILDALKLNDTQPEKVTKILLKF